MSDSPDHMSVDEYPELASWPTADKTIEAIRAIHVDHSAKVIDGVLVDAATAKAICMVYDALDDAHRAKLMALSIERIGHLAWRVVK
jgi:hypothetical protein